MKLLFLTPQLPFPPTQGATLRNFNLIQHLARRHAVDLLTLLAPGEELTPDNRLHEICGRIGALDQPTRTLRQRAVATATSAAPDMARRLDSAQMHELTRQFAAAKRYDIVQIEGIEMAQYGLAATQSLVDGESGSALIFDNHNCEYVLQRRNATTDLRDPRRWLAAGYSLVQWQKLLRYEARICQRADATVAVSQADREALLQIAPEADIAVVSNGINIEEYAPSTTFSSGERSNLVFTGKMDYRPNIDAVLWFASEVLPRILAETPDVRFQIVGRNPHARLDALRANPAIEITGEVDDTRPYIANAAVYIIPMRVGGGTRFKALEAMASSAAIVSTSLGVEGIPITPGRELEIADTPSAFATAVLALLADARGSGQRRRELGKDARRFVEEHYTWEQIVPDLEDVYSRVMAAGSRE